MFTCLSLTRPSRLGYVMHSGIFVALEPRGKLAKINDAAGTIAAVNHGTQESVGSWNLGHKSLASSDYDFNLIP